MVLGPGWAVASTRRRYGLVVQLVADRFVVASDVDVQTSFAMGSSVVGPLQVTVRESVGSSGSTFEWSIANAGDTPMAVQSVALVFALADVPAPLRMFRNGYQSWTPSGMATFRLDSDPSSATGSSEMVRSMHHADPGMARPGELRSEWVTVLRGAGSSPVLVGFDGGDRHDGTLRLREGQSGAELWAEAFLGGAVIAPGKEHSLHAVMVLDRAADGSDASMLLASWADEVGRIGRARVRAPYQVGWCSWYHYFELVSEADVRSNLVLADKWPFDVFQLDDGYQSTIGDWLTTNQRFPSGLGAVADAVTAAGRQPGLWLAPFIVAPDSRVAIDHPDWLVRDADGELAVGMINPQWEGGLGGLMYALDTTNPEVLAHLASLAAALVDRGFTYLKLDFTFVPSFGGVYCDPSQTPAQRVPRGFRRDSSRCR